MAMKDNFLQEVKIGDTVELMVGPKEMTGVVVSFDAETVRIQRENGKEAVLALDSISYYEIGEVDVPVEEKAQSSKQTETKAVKGNVGNVKLSVSPASTKSEKTGAKEKKNTAKNALKELANRGDTFFIEQKRPVVKDYKDVVKNVDGSLKGEMLGIVNSLDYAMKQNHEVSPDDYKIQENIGKIKRLMKKNPHSKAPYNLLGSVYFRCKSEGQALDAYENGDDNASGYTVAESMNKEEKKLMFASRHFVLDQEPNAYIYRYLLSKMVNKNDYSLCSKISVESISDTQIQAYHSFLRAVLLVNDIAYDQGIDNDITRDTVADLLQLLEKGLTGSKSEFVKYLPEEKTVVKLKNQNALTEYPIFAEAERVRMIEKDQEKAATLYIQAILANEKPGSAVGNLYRILIHKKQYKDCAMYLGRYGSKYMREEAYNNLKRELLRVAPAMKDVIKRYEGREKDKDPIEDFFVIAQKAEIEEKDLQKAITNYKKAIEKRQRLSSSVPNLAAIYSRMGMFDEALILLDTTGKKAMEELAYLNLKKDILKAAKDKKYAKEVRDTYNRLIHITSSPEKKAEQLYYEAFLLSEMEEYDLAIDLFLKCKLECKPEIYTTKEKYDNRRIAIVSGLCKAYYKLGKMETAKKYANEILQLDSDNEFAQSVLAGQLVEDDELMIESIGNTQINQYIQHLINELKFEQKIIDKDWIKNGVFVGPLDQAIRLLNNISDSSTNSSDETKSHAYFTCAKLIKLILDSDVNIDLREINEYRYLSFIAAGSYSYASLRLNMTELNDNTDVARYFLIQTAMIYDHSEKVQPLWAIATLLYIETFFYSIVKIRYEQNELATMFDVDVEDQNFIDQLTRIMEDNIRDIDTFTSGMIEFLTYNTRVKKEILFLINANARQGQILDSLAKILDTTIMDEDIDSYEAFEKTWDNAAKAYLTKRKAYHQLICETVESVLEVGRLGENIEKLEAVPFKQFLNNTDKENIDQLCAIFRLIQKYSELSEYKSKSDQLREAEAARKELVGKIEEYPTFFSYEKLLPEIEKMQFTIIAEFSSFYGSTEPQITVSVSEEDISVEEGAKEVRVPIAFKNEANVQTADNVQISIVGDSVKLMNDKQLRRIPLVGGGSAIEEILTFKINDNVLKEQVFSFEVTVKYQYYTNMTDKKEVSKTFVLSVPLNTKIKFEPIENKFEKYRSGSAVTDSKMFYGRDKDIEDIIQQISNNVRMKQGRCLTLYGQTRTGKTSLLYHLEQKLREMDPDGNIIINIGSIGVQDLTGNNITAFLFTIMKELVKELKSKEHPGLFDLIQASGIELDPKQLLKDPDNAQLYFNSEFAEVCQFLNEQEKQYNIILMIDEFTYIYDWIRSKTMTDRIMKFWKGFIQNNGIFAVIIGQDHMMKFVNDQRFTNDFGSTVPWKVTYLPEEDAKRLMYEPIMFENEKGEKVSRYREGALKRLYELTAGSAYLIMNLCAGLVDYLNEVKAVYITKAHIDDYLRKKLASFDESFFEPQYNDKSEVDPVKVEEAIERNKKMLKKIARQSDVNGWAWKKNVCTSKEDKAVIDSLEMRDVLVVQEDKRCKIKVELYKEWILEKYGLEATDE